MWSSRPATNLRRGFPRDVELAVVAQETVDAKGVHMV